MNIGLLPTLIGGEEKSKCADLFRFSLSDVWEGNYPMFRGRMLAWYFILSVRKSAIFLVVFTAFVDVLPINVFRYDAGSLEVNFPRLSVPLHSLCEFMNLP